MICVLFLNIYYASILKSIKEEEIAQSQRRGKVRSALSWRAVGTLEANQGGGKTPRERKTSRVRILE